MDRNRQHEHEGVFRKTQKITLRGGSQRRTGGSLRKISGAELRSAPDPLARNNQLEHELGGMFDVTHGAGLAAVWPSWARYVYKECLPRFVRYARNVMGVTLDGSEEEVAEAGICAMEDFYHRIGMPVNLNELGIYPTDDQIEIMAKQCMAASGEDTGSAKKLNGEDAVCIYKNARV